MKNYTILYFFVLLCRTQLSASCKQAKCRICRQKYIYIESKFREHIKDWHPKIFKYEETCKGRQEWPWICFKYNDTSISQCLLCRQNFQSDFPTLASHLRQKHFNETKNYVFHAWIWKYLKKSSDFESECNKCSNKYSISLNKNLSNHIVTIHSEELRHAQETRNVVHSSISVWNSKVIEVTENIWEYYTKLTYFQARCKLQNCTYKCCFIYIGHLSKHVREMHEAISEWEEAHKNEKPWIYFKYSNEYTSDKNILHSECLMCGEFPIAPDSTRTHLSEKHSEEELRNFIDNHWTMKYFRQSDDTTEFKCAICCKKIIICINSEVSEHIIESHSEELQSNFSTKNMQKLRQNYILQDFQAKCQSCNFQSCYVNTTNFTEHVQKEHEEVYNHEEAHEHTYPWMYFTYFTLCYLQCRCCNKVVVCIYDFLKKHLDDHSSESFLNTSFHKSGWEGKYYTQSNDFEVQCIMCRSKISLNIPLWYFDRHIEDRHSNGLTSTQTTCDIAGPSGSQPN